MNPLRLLLPLAALALTAVPLSATWSIVVVNTKTGEVAVASATCIQSFTLENWVPVVLVGNGVAATQANADIGARWRTVIYADYLAGMNATDTLQHLLDSFVDEKGRQVGLVTLLGGADQVTYSGTNTQAWSGGVTGISGDLRYAIQGNVLTGQPVVLATEAALLDTPGDLSQKLMAAMQAAKSFGGDGRCSCATNDPDGCGSPPPDFEKSAHVGFVILARIGDTDGPCNGISGCAQGDYYLEIADHGGVSSPDPVDSLQILYDSWRADLSGRPDGLLSRVILDRESLPADGRTVALARVHLVDVEGVGLILGGATVQVTPAPGSSSDAQAGAVIDHGDGSYSFPITAGLASGTASFEVSADDGATKATLYPYLDVRIDSLSALHCGFDAVPATTGARVPLVVNESSSPNAFYVIVASVSGTSPGTMVGDILVPLNFDEVTTRTLLRSSNPLLPMTRGLLDATGHGEGALCAPPGLLREVIGLRMDWSALTFDGHTLRATNPAGFVVVHGP
jgi:hypothetical protein